MCALRSPLQCAQRLRFGISTAHGFQADGLGRIAAPILDHEIAGHDQLSAIGVKRQSGGAASRAIEPKNFSAFCDFPDTQSTILATADEAFAAEVESEGCYSGGVALQNAELACRGCVPDAHHAQPVAGGN